MLPFIAIIHIQPSSCASCHTKRLESCNRSDLRFKHLIVFYFREDEHDGLGKTVLVLRPKTWFPTAQCPARGAEQNTGVSALSPAPTRAESHISGHPEQIFFIYFFFSSPLTGQFQITPISCARTWTPLPVWLCSPPSPTWLRPSGSSEGRRSMRWSSLSVKLPVTHVLPAFPAEPVCPDGIILLPSAAAKLCCVILD